MPTLPTELEPVRMLSRKAGGEVWLVLRAGAAHVLRIDADARSHALEAALSTRVRHRRLVAPVDWGHTPEGAPYVLRPFVEGSTLDLAYLEANGQEVVGWTTQLLDVLGALHGAGLLHRDIKAANVIVGADGVALVDLDLMSRTMDRAAGAGTPFHIAPEVLRGLPHSPAADLFSLGAMLALLACGTPDPRFHARFPGRSFWDASGLDPERLPPGLSNLVRALVRRHPADRPASATAAKRLLTGAVEDGDCSLALPLLQGREQDLERLVELARPPGTLLLVEVADPDEVDALAGALECELVIDGSTAARPSEEHCPVVPASGRPLDELVDAGLSFLLARGRDRLAIVSPVGLGAALEQAIRARTLEGEDARLRAHAWPLVPEEAIAGHLERLSGGASPHAARELAATLRRLSGGRLAQLSGLIAHALEEGVLRRRGPVIEILRTDWEPKHSGIPTHAAELDALPAGTRATLSALAALGQDADLERLAALLGSDERTLAVELAELHRLGAIALPGRERGRLGIDGRWRAAVRDAHDPGAWRALHSRCARVLEERGAQPHRVAAHELAAAKGAPALRTVLEVAEALRVGGQPARARELCQGVEERAPAGARALLERAVVTRARLELGLGDPQRALAAIRERFDGELAALPTRVALVAAEAAEAAGLRAEARDAYAAIRDRSARAEERLQATVGMAYARFLDGETAAALEAIEGLPGPHDPHRPAGALLNLRAGALARLGRLEPALEVLDDAMRRARASGDPTLVGRTELNRAFVDRRLGQPVRAVAALRRAMEAFSAAGHVPFRALSANNLGALHRDLGELRHARECLDLALDLRRRAGDAHGTGSSLGSLALVALEAGELASARQLFERARAVLRRGDYGAELALVELHSVLALSACGELEEAETLWRSPKLEGTRSAHPLLNARARAALELARGEEDAARATLAAAAGWAPREGDLAERFRLTATWLALEPGSDEARTSLEEIARQLGSPARVAEAAWRSRDMEALVDTQRSREQLAQFEAAGRPDLVRAVALELAAAFDRAGRVQERRQTRERARTAADTLFDGIPDARRVAASEQGLRLAGGNEERVRMAGLDIDWFTACNRRFAAEEDLEGLLLAIIDQALEITAGRRGLIVLMDGERVSVQAARGMNQETMAPEEARFSRSVVTEATQSMRPVLTTDAGADPRFAAMDSVSSFELRSVLCVPFQAAAHRALGALYLDDAERRSAFDELDVKRVRALADQASIAISNLRRRKEIERLNDQLRKQVEYQKGELVRARRMLRRTGDRAPLGGLIGSGEAMQGVYHLIERLGPTSLAVLITGPSGSGKDLVARALHEYSERATGPLVIENVAALPVELVESELFGHVRGAFTGASVDKQGLFEEAHGGTFFLDEIGEMPMEVQAKLLRLLESGEFRPVGSRRTVQRDVRLVAATNRDLMTLVREGRFREDLYYRLNAAGIRLPPLSERLEDIPELISHFLARLAEKHGKDKPLAAAVLARLVERAWPGEVRELQNELSRLYFLAGDRIDDPAEVRAPAPEPLAEGTAPRSLRLEDAERAAILRALEAAGGRKDRAAKLLGISRAGLYNKLARLEL